MFNFTFFKCFILIFFACFSPFWAAIQEITIYEQPDQQGEFINLRKKYANISDWKFFLDKAGSYCSIGFWIFYDGPDFEFETGKSHRVTSAVRTCKNLEFSIYKSLRYIGPADFTVPAISLIEGDGVDNFSMREVVITGPAGNNFGFEPVSVHTFGNSAWTFFTGNDFSGESLCYNSTNGEGAYTSVWHVESEFKIQSVVKGCAPGELAGNLKMYKNHVGAE